MRVSRVTIYKVLRTGELPAFRLGSDWRFNAEQIDSLCWDRKRLLTNASIPQV